MLLCLMVHQLTASIPDSYPRALEVCQWACQLACNSLWTFFQRATCGLHHLPLSAAYSGPQLALLVTPSSLGPTLAAQQAQQAQQPCAQHPQQRLQWYNVTPTAQLLTELLPLLTSYSINRVQQHHRAAGQQLPAPQPLQQAETVQHTAGAHGSSAPPGSVAHLLETLQQVTG